MVATVAARVAPRAVVAVRVAVARAVEERAAAVRAGAARAVVVMAVVARVVVERVAVERVEAAMAAVVMAVAAMVAAMVVAATTVAAMAVAAMAAATATGCLRWGLSQTQTQIPNRSRSRGPLIALACHLDHRLCQGLLERAVAAQARSRRNKWPLPSRHWPSRALPRSPTVRAGRVSVVACRACRGATKPRLYWPQGLLVPRPAPRGTRG